ncbi:MULTISPECIES: shikimate dehydrogenase family protein [Roseobacteraceae]|jgi:shikimate dehydrogenase|uniref:Quinate/shikimate dehydrogenase (NAD(+)) n=1 Tax=Pseudosulfitobacter pseudonitzschiae TaxID=1402135 RepID=A0A221JVY5_9RHOB|nr:MULTISPECIES: shikimate dehydrogenase [Roseobacteraceae]ASM70908.1 quinate/shikimate dehydrogenase (NAD(+)) [Pseudosulfitobacter pseudonitzschiae]
MSQITPVKSGLQLGLIGDNIAQSRAPLLHRLAGAQNGIAVQYDRLVPPDRGESFDRVFDHCAAAGFRGINVTYPYKERAVARTQIVDPLVRAIGAINTVIFEGDTPQGFNTDYSGFMTAYQSARGTQAPGTVLMIGTGGVGRAVAFGLASLGVSELRLVDRDFAKAKALAATLRSSAPDATISVSTDAEQAAKGVSGVINCTPVGMVGYDGTPLPRTAMSGAEWAFDAVYTPKDTHFLTDAAAEGLRIISGWELFFHQGVHAWALFSGTPLDEAALRQALEQAD